MKRVALLTIALFLALASSAHAGGFRRCVVGLGGTAPATCQAVHSSIYEAVDAQPDPNLARMEELRLYGVIAAPDTVVLRQQKMTGYMSGTTPAVLDGSANPGAVLVLQDSFLYVLQDVGVMTSGEAGGIGILFNQAGQVKGNGLQVQGPEGGLGIGIDIRPGAGRVTMYGNTRPFLIEGQHTGIKAERPGGRPSPNGAKYRDVQVGVHSIDVPLGQWFRSTFDCLRPGSIGVLSVNEHADHNGLTIRQCSVGIQIECNAEGVCGEGNQWDNQDIVAPTPVRVILPGGGAVDDYKADPNCGDVWGINTLNGVRTTKFAVSCSPK